MKTARWIGAVLMLVCVGAFLFISDYVGIVIAVCGASVFGISFFCSLLGRFGIKLFLHSSEIKKEDQAILFQIEIKNHSVFPSGWLHVCIDIKNLFTGESESKRITIPLNVHADTSVEISKSHAHCGMYEICVRSALLYGFFGVIPIPCKKPQPVRTVKIPVRLPVDLNRVSLPMKDMFETSENSVGTLHTDMVGVHEYLPGDSMQNVHWKLSARTDQLFVREYAAPQAADLSLIAVNETSCGTVEKMEQWACVLHTLASLLIDHQVSFDTVYFDENEIQQRQRITSGNDWKQVLEQMLSVSMKREAAKNGDNSSVKSNNFTDEYTMILLPDGAELEQWIGKSNTNILYVGTPSGAKYANEQRLFPIAGTNLEELRRVFTALLVREEGR